MGFGTSGVWTTKTEILRQPEALRLVSQSHIRRALGGEGTSNSNDHPQHMGRSLSNAV